MGKTTGIKLLINELSSENLFSVLYLNCEIFSSFRDLLQALRWYLDFKGRKGVRKSYIFLDVEGIWRFLQSWEGISGCRPRWLAAEAPHPPDVDAVPH